MPIQLNQLSQKGNVSYILRRLPLGKSILRQTLLSFQVVRYLGRLQTAVFEGMQGSKTVCKAFQGGGTEEGAPRSRRKRCHRHAKQTGQAG